MGTVILSKDSNPAYEIIFEWASRQDKHLYNEDSWYAYKEAMQACLVIVVNDLRMQRYGNYLNSVPGYSAADMAETLFYFKEEYTKVLESKDKPASLKGFYENAINKINNFVRRGDLDTKMEVERQTRVLAGKEKPHETDEEWLTRKLDESLQETLRLNKILEENNLL